jgi:hypothetical protein
MALPRPDYADPAQVLERRQIRRPRHIAMVIVAQVAIEDRDTIIALVPEAQRELVRQYVREFESLQRWSNRFKAKCTNP